MKNLICIDASIQSTGVSIYNFDTKETYLYSYTNKVKKDLEFKCDGFHVKIVRQDKSFEKVDKFFRYIHISETIFNEIEPFLSSDTNIYIEGFSYGSVGMIFDLAGFTALLKLPFYRANYTIESISPSDWKKHVTGKGNATKDIIYNVMLNSELREVLAEFVVRGYPYKKGSWVEDIADVYSIQKCILNM
jgi:Holliday junction resolvasome RuvABC endonuclease subunit